MVSNYQNQCHLTIKNNESLIWMVTRLVVVIFGKFDGKEGSSILYGKIMYD